MSEHTKIPWHWLNSDDDSPYSGEGNPSLRTVKKYGKNETIVKDGKSYTSFALAKFILNAEPGLTMADAAFIVQACNAHDQLVEALNKLAALGGGRSEGNCIAQEALTALAKGTP